MLDLKSLVPLGEKSRVLAKHEPSRDPLVAFHREVDRLFDDFFPAARRGTGPMTDTKAWSAGVPSPDVTESDQEVIVAAELPGVDDKDFEVTLSGDVLTIKGEKKHEHEEKDGACHYVERSYGSFSRSVRLPLEASGQDVKADFDKGVLTVRIPKPADVQSEIKQIEVKAH